jgi:hypothetical protein
MCLPISKYPGGDSAEAQNFLPGCRHRSKFHSPLAWAPAFGSASSRVVLGEGGRHDDLQGLFD